MVRARFFKTSIFLSLLIRLAVAQTQVNLKTQSKAVDFGNAPYTRPLKIQTTLPATCTLNELLFLSTAPVGANIYACISTNSWATEGGSSILGGDLTGSSSAATVQALQWNPVSANAPQTGQALIWDGTNWIPESISGSAGQIIVQNTGTVVGTRGVMNFIAGTGVLNAITDTGTKFNIQQSADTAVILNKATLQSGRALLCAPVSGSGTAYTCSMTPTLTAYTIGMVLHLMPDVAAVGGATTLNIDILGAQRIKLADGVTDPSAGDLAAGREYTVSYDGTNFRLNSPPIDHSVLTKAVYQSGQALLCSPATGSGSTYTCSTNPALTAYTIGMVVNLIPDVAGAGGATTLSINGLGAHRIKFADGVTDPAAGDLAAGNEFTLWYDGTNFRLMSAPIDHSILTKAGNQSGQTLSCAPASASGTAYACSMNPVLLAYTIGMVVNLTPDVIGAGGATTLSINGLASHRIKFADGVTDPVAGDLAAGNEFALWYDGTNFRLMAPPAFGFGYTAAQPTCDLAHRGRLWQTLGATGVKDAFSVCAKDATNAYAWRVIY